MRVLPSTQVYEKYGLTATKNVIPILIPYKAGSKTWLLTLDIDADNLADTAQSGAVLESQTFCCVDAQGTVVYNTGNHQFDKEELSRIGSSSVAGELFILESCRLGDETYFLAGKRGIGDLLYFTMIPLSQIRQTASQLNQSLLFFFLMFLLLFFILAVIYLCQLYHPFRIILRMSSRVETEQAGALLQNPFDRFGQIEAIYQAPQKMLRKLEERSDLRAERHFSGFLKPRQGSLRRTIGRCAGSTKKENDHELSGDPASAYIPI